MSHQSIYETRHLEQRLLRQRIEIPDGNVGLLYSDGRLQERLPPRESISLRVKGRMTLYLVEISPRSFVLDLRLPDRTGSHKFPLRVTLDYQVEPDKAERLLDRGVTDVENYLQNEFETSLRDTARRHHIHEYERFQQAAESGIANYDYAAIGVRRTKFRVEVDQSDETFQAQIQRVKEMMRRRTVSNEFSMADESGRHRFPLKVTIDYRVTNVELLIEQSVAETEAQMMRDLETLLRRKSREFQLNQYKQLLQELDKSIHSNIFHDLGLAWLQHDIEIRSDDQQFQEGLRELDDRDRWMRAPQLASHEIMLPSKEGHYYFEAQVSVTYRVIDPNQMSRRTPAETEVEIWSTIAPKIRAISCKHCPGQEQAAAQEINHELGRQTFNGYGMQISNISVGIRPNPVFVEREGQIAGLKHENQIKNMTQKADIQRKSEAMDFFINKVRGGHLEMLGLKLASNPDDIESVIQKLDSKEQEIFERKIVVLKTMMANGGEYYGEKITEMLDDLSRTIANAQLAMLPPPERERLEHGSAENNIPDPIQPEDKTPTGGYEKPPDHSFDNK